jgi:hypothetical protein
MFRRFFILFLSALLCGPARSESKIDGARDRLKKEILSSALASPPLQRFLIETVLPHVSNPLFLRAVRKQNERRLTMLKILELDKDWISSPPDSPFKKHVLSTECSEELRRIAAREKSVAEAFVMDNQGAVVGETNVTTDYWQGDERKWIDSYHKGTGAAYIAPAEFDDSANVVLQQVSLPVLDEKGRVVGAMTWGIVLDRLAP